LAVRLVGEAGEGVGVTIDAKLDVAIGRVVEVVCGLEAFERSGICADGIEVGAVDDVVLEVDVPCLELDLPAVGLVVRAGVAGIGLAVGRCDGIVRLEARRFQHEQAAGMIPSLRVRLSRS